MLNVTDQSIDVNGKGTGTYITVTQTHTPMDTSEATCGSLSLPRILKYTGWRRQGSNQCSLD